MNTYKLNELAVENDLTKKIMSLVEEQNCIEIQGVGLIDTTNVGLICNTINMMLSINNNCSTKKTYKKRSKEFDLMIARYSKTHSIGETSKTFDIPRSTVHYIKKKYEACN